MTTHTAAQLVPASSAARTLSRAGKLRRNVSLSALMMATALCAAAPHAAFAADIEATSGQTKNANGTFDDSAVTYAVDAHGGTINVDGPMTVNVSRVVSTRAYGILARIGGTVNINNVTTVNVTRGNKTGIVAYNAGSSINMNADVTILVNSNGVTGENYGVTITAGAHFTSNATSKLTIDMQDGLSVFGFYVSGPGSVVNLAGGADITSAASGISSNGVSVNTNSLLIGNNVNITMAPATSTDVRASALRILNNGTVDLTGGTITSASTGNGVDIQTGSTATLTNVTIKTLNDAANGHGSFTSDIGRGRGVSILGGTLNLDNSSVTTNTTGQVNGFNQADGYGVAVVDYTNSGGTHFDAVANIKNGTTISTSGANAAGLYVRNYQAANGSIINSATSAVANVTGSFISTSGAGAFGVSVAGGTANVDAASTITTTGAGAIGVNVAGSGATIAIANIDASTVTTTGVNAYGLNITGGTANVTGASSISTTGDGSTGVRLAGANATIAIANIAGSTVTVTNANARGVDVEGGTANLTAGTRITTVGANADGLYANSTNAIINSDASRVTTSGANSPGLHAVDGGKIVFSNSTVTTSDASSAGIVTSGATGGSIVEVTDATIVTPGDAIQTSGGPGTIVFTGVTTTPGSGVVLNAQASATTFTADSSTFTGSMLLGTGTSAVTLTNGTMWNMTGSSVATDLTNDNSTIAFSAPTGDPTLLSSYKTLTVNNYTGNSGTIRLNTYLGGDGSHSDLLVIDGGTATGSTLLDIRSTGGTSVQSAANGIKVVQSNGAVTNTGSDDHTTFQLAHRVAAGAYEYFLHANGVGDDSNDQNWYLRNVYAGPPDPSGPKIPRPEVPTDTVILPQAINYGYAMSGSLDDRIGGFDGGLGGNGGYANNGSIYEERSVWCKGKNAHNPDATVDPANPYKCIVRVPVAQQELTLWARSGWGSLIGAHGSHERNNYWKNGPDYNYDFAGLKAGLDVWARQKADGTLDKAGVYVGYGQINATAYGPEGVIYGSGLTTYNPLDGHHHKAGTVDMDAYTVGSYWTHYAPQGWYTDAMVQGTWYTNTSAKSVLNEKISPDGFGILGALEGGYKFQLGSGWALTPQAQVMFEHVTFDHASDRFGTFSIQDGDSLRTRLGARLSKDWNYGDAAHPRRVMAYVRANVWHEFLGNLKTTVVAGPNDESPLTSPSSLKGTWGEIGIGLKAQVSDKVDLFANGDYQHSFNGEGMQGWNGRVGLTARW